MKDKFITYEELVDESNQAEIIGESLSNKLLWLERTITYIFLKIKDSHDEDEVEWYFKCLDTLQGTLAKLAFKYDIKISERLHRFMNDFDNFEEAKEYYFEKIQSGEYTF